MLPRHRQRGFSLIELAVVLVIVGFLLGGLLIPLSSQIGQRDRQTTVRQLDEIREALLGYALVNGHFPCAFIPDPPTANPTTADPTNAGYGVANASCSTPATEQGYLPWKTLGLNSGIDAWGHPRSLATDPWNGFFRYRVDRNFSDSTSPITLTTPFSSDSLMVRDSSTPDTAVGCDPTSNPKIVLLTTTTERPVVIVYSTGPDIIANAENATRESESAPISGCYEGGGITSTFDDMTIWIARPVLFNRMVAAGRLP